MITHVEEGSGRWESSTEVGKIVELMGPFGMHEEYVACSLNCISAIAGGVGDVDVHVKHSTSFAGAMTEAKTKTENKHFHRGDGSDLGTRNERRLSGVRSMVGRIVVIASLRHEYIVASGAVWSIQCRVSVASRFHNFSSLKEFLKIGRFPLDCDALGAVVDRYKG